MIPRVLILAGATEARTLTETLAARRDIETSPSLAGVTERPEQYAIRPRVGGFGGADGLAAFLDEEKIAALIDATHPFATQIGRNAITASRSAAIPYLRLERPPWRAGPDDRWIACESPEHAARRLPSGARVFLALGNAKLAPFAERADIWPVARMISPPPAPPFKNGLVIEQRPPYPLDAETALLERHQITHIVCKNSGGRGAEAKLLAARALGLTVLMIPRPPIATGIERVETIPAAIRWLEAKLGLEPEPEPASRIEAIRELD